MKSSVNLKLHLRQEEETEFSMVNDKHQTRETIILTIQDKEHTFFVVPVDFSLPEGRIIEESFNLTGLSILTMKFTCFYLFIYFF